MKGPIYIYVPRRIYTVYIMCYRAISLKLLIISKNVSDKSFSVREGRHTGPTYFFIGGGAEVVLTYEQYLIHLIFSEVCSPIYSFR